jgi:hypothetical protein
VASLTSRGKALAGIAFLASAVLCAGAATALVKASDHDTSDGTAAPRPEPTLIAGSTSPTPASSPTPAAATTPSASPTATAAATSSPTSPSPSPRTSSASPRPRTTSSPRSTNPEGLALSATLNPQSGDIFVNDLITLKAHATDGQGSISLKSLTWGDGSKVTGGSGSSCTPPASGGDCANFSFSHRYQRSGTFHIVLQVTSGGETQALAFDIQIFDRGEPSPTPSATATP